MSESSDSEKAYLPASQQGQLNQDFSSYTHDGNFAVFFKLVRTRQDVEEDIKKDTFYPDFVHQFFVDTERIFGYTKPILRLYYTASRLKRYVKFDYDEKLTREKDGIEADDVMECISPILNDSEYTHDLNQFIAEVESKEEKSFRPPANLLSEFEKNYKKPKMLSRAQLEQLEMADINSANGDSNGNHAQTNGCSSKSNRSVLERSNSPNDQGSSSTKRYQIFHATRDTKNFGSFQNRMQTLIMWFIESATMIDFEDSKWDFFLIFEKFNPSASDDSQATSVSTEDRYFFVGYSTVYRYYAYPDKTRPRVSQMLLLPPYRRNGLGTLLLQAIYDYYKKQPSTLDITAEDPDEEFISMRDFLDCRNCLELPVFKPDMLNLGWSDEIAKEAKDKLRLCNRQARKIYEILRLRNLDSSDEQEMKKYRLEIKNRLNIPNQRLKLDCDKVKKLGFELPEDMRVRLENPKLTAASLDENYQELVKQYKRTIDKLNHLAAN